MSDPTSPAPPTRWSATSAPKGDAYDDRWAALASAGHDPHGEAAFVLRYAPTTVLDAGCGTGRVGRELARRGVTVVGVDNDADMLATAVARGPGATWHLADLATLDLSTIDPAALDRGTLDPAAPDRPQFDVVVLAGNVMIFLAPGTEGAVLHRLAAHTRPGGRLIAGFQLQAGRLDLATYDALAAAAGWSLEDRFATWEGAPFTTTGADYAVSVHRRA